MGTLYTYEKQVSDALQTSNVEEKKKEKRDRAQKDLKDNLISSFII
uniref:Uncharacterized protein n=1 Tax=Rhizophora mucronata TaxID=61149 RepID=A0A2P2PI39_RHIMU